MNNTKSSTGSPKPKIEMCNIKVIINASLDHVWKCWNEPEIILKWYHASDDWTLTHAINNLEVGKQFNYGMASIDGKFSFDLIGEYTKIQPKDRIEYVLVGSEPERIVYTTFVQKGDTIHVEQSFTPENQNSIELQLEGWQAILNNFKKECESSK